MENFVTRDVVEKWLKAWSLSRELPLPVSYKSGFKIDVGYEKQKNRYVFPELNDDFTQLSKNIDEPWIFLKVCAAANEIIIQLMLLELWIKKGNQPQSVVLFLLMIWPFMIEFQRKLIIEEKALQHF